MKVSEVNYDVEILKALDLPLTKKYYLALVYPNGVPEDEVVEFPAEITDGKIDER